LLHRHVSRETWAAGRPLRYSQQAPARMGAAPPHRPIPTVADAAPARIHAAPLPHPSHGPRSSPPLARPSRSRPPWSPRASPAAARASPPAPPLRSSSAPASATTPMPGNSNRARRASTRHRSRTGTVTTLSSPTWKRRTSTGPRIRTGSAQSWSRAVRWRTCFSTTRRPRQTRTCTHQPIRTMVSPTESATRPSAGTRVNTASRASRRGALASDTTVVGVGRPTPFMNKASAGTWLQDRPCSLAKSVSATTN
jgi:hypothetical protein